MLILSGGITKHMCDGLSPYFVIGENDLSEDFWKTYNTEALKNQYKEYICPVCNQLHFKLDSGVRVYGYCGSDSGK